MALGDSFSSGEGSPNFYSGCFLDGLDTKGVNRCHRSVEAYPVKLWRQLPGYSLRFVACSGGVMDDYYSANPNNKNEPAQRTALASRPDLVTLTMGGNDGGFASVLKWCVLDVGPAPFADVHLQWTIRATGISLCRERIRKAADDLNRMSDENNNPPRPGGRTGHKLQDFYRDLRADAGPQAKVIVLGYPSFFPANPPSSCETGLGTQLPGLTRTATTFSRAEMLELNRVLLNANLVIERLATQAGFYFVNVNEVLRPNATLCQDDSKIRGLNRLIPSDQQRSFHPSIATYQREADLIAACLADQGGCTPPSPPLTPATPDGTCSAITARPVTIGFCGAEGFSIDGLRWSRWDGLAAIGAGTMTDEEGNVAPVHVQLVDPVTYAGRLVFRSMLYNFGEGDPGRAIFLDLELYPRDIGQEQAHALRVRAIQGTSAMSCTAGAADGNQVAERCELAGHEGDLLYDLNHTDLY